MTESWEKTTVHKPRPASRLSLGQTRFDDKGREQPIGPEQSNKAAHVMCVEHVEVDGLKRPVCITRGADREQLIAEARELAGAE